MKAALSLLAFTATAFAANLGPRGHDVYLTRTTEVDVSYPTTCAVTDTITEEGRTYYTTYTTTSTCYTKVLTTIYETVHGPDVTKTAKDVAYTTITSLCPVTETKTIGGSTVCVTWTSTSTIIKEVPTTVPVYVTSVTTVYETTDVYTTTTCPVTTYTTIIKGSTVCVTVTNTETITLSSAYTVTEVIPVTSTVEVEMTVQVTEGSAATITQPSMTLVYETGTVYQTTSMAPVTVQPTAGTATGGPVTAAANAKNAPAAAFLAGVLGAVALL